MKHFSLLLLISLLSICIPTFGNNPWDPRDTCTTDLDDMDTSTDDSDPDDPETIFKMI